ncbi:MAG TPA: ABC transporter permease subunit [Candidatus Eisenbacteria bacterium]|jgi:ABC-type transport system involved in multi-copper enzyme maturation permease subunit|nr:ABC transporter permease subunit [Candidatus Eisenbacteria bacterium]
MSRLLIVARNTFREAVRDRVLYNLVFFAFLMIASAVIVGQISMDIETVVMVSLGLSAISLIGLLIAVFMGVGLVSKEIDKRTLHAVLAKPLRRWEFLLGKFAGLVVTLAVNTVAMAAGLFAALWLVKHSIARGDAVVLVAVYFILLKLMLVVALAMLFSCFTSPLLAILFTGGLYLAGMFVSELRSLQLTNLTPQMQKFFAVISYVLPNFGNYDVMGAAAHGRSIAAMLIVHNTLYTILYCAIVLGAAAVIFSRKDLK